MTTQTTEQYKSYTIQPNNNDGGYLVLAPNGAALTLSVKTTRGAKILITRHLSHDVHVLAQDQAARVWALYAEFAGMTAGDDAAAFIVSVIKDASDPHAAALAVAQWDVFAVHAARESAAAAATETQATETQATDAARLVQLTLELQPFLDDNDTTAAAMAADSCMFDDTPAARAHLAAVKRWAEWHDVHGAELQELRNAAARKEHARELLQAQHQAANIKQVTRAEYHAHMLQTTRARNAGVRLQHSAKRGETKWTIKGVIAGITRGPVNAITAYFIDSAARDTAAIVHAHRVHVNEYAAAILQNITHKTDAARDALTTFEEVHGLPAAFIMR